MAKPNGYMYYLSERRAADRRNGLPPQPDAVYGAEWGKLSAEEKRRYKEKAQGRNAAANGHVASAPASALSADSVTGAFREVEIRDSEEQELYALIEALVPADRTAAAGLKVVIAASNVMVKTTEGRFYPMEVGLVRYSLAEGAISKYQQFTDPGETPQGYMFQAQTHITNTHRIPLNFDRAIGRQKRQQDFENMMDEISIFVSDCQFQHKGKNFIIMFTKEDMVEQVTGTMHSFLTDSQHPDLLRMWHEHRFRVVDISLLIHRLYVTADVQMPLPLCADIPNMTSFDWTPGSCEWHTAADNNNCALGACMRWCYLISDCLLSAFNIDAIPGKHLPVIDQTGIHVEEASDDVWNVSRDRRSVRNFMTPSVNGDAGHAAPSAPVSAAGVDPGQSRHLDRDPPPRDYEAPGNRPAADSRLAGGVGRGMRRK